MGVLNLGNRIFANAGVRRGLALVLAAIMIIGAFAGVQLFSSASSDTSPGTQLTSGSGSGGTGSSGSGSGSSGEGSTSEEEGGKNTSNTTRWVSTFISPIEMDGTCPCFEMFKDLDDQQKEDLKKSLSEQGEGKQYCECIELLDCKVACGGEGKELCKRCWSTCSSEIYPKDYNALCRCQDCDCVSKLECQKKREDKSSGHDCDCECEYEGAFLPAERLTSLFGWRQNYTTGEAGAGSQGLQVDTTHSQSGHEHYNENHYDLDIDAKEGEGIERTDTERQNGIISPDASPTIPLTPVYAITDGTVYEVKNVEADTQDEKTYLILEHDTTLPDYKKTYSYYGGLFASVKLSDAVTKTLNNINEATVYSHWGMNWVIKSSVTKELILEGKSLFFMSSLVGEQLEDLLKISNFNSASQLVNSVISVGEAKEAGLLGENAQGWDDGSAAGVLSAIAGTGNPDPELKKEVDYYKTMMDYYEGPYNEQKDRYSSDSYNEKNDQGGNTNVPYKREYEYYKSQYDSVKDKYDKEVIKFRAYKNLVGAFDFDKLCKLFEETHHYFIEGENKDGIIQDLWFPTGVLNKDWTWYEYGKAEEQLVEAKRDKKDERDDSELYKGMIGRKVKQGDFIGWVGGGIIDPGAGHAYYYDIGINTFTMRHLDFTILTHGPKDKTKNDEEAPIAPTPWSRGTSVNPRNWYVTVAEGCKCCDERYCEPEPKIGANGEMIPVLKCGVCETCVKHYCAKEPVDKDGVPAKCDDCGTPIKFESCYNEAGCSGCGCTDCGRPIEVRGQDAYVYIAADNKAWESKFDDNTDPTINVASTGLYRAPNGAVYQLLSEFDYWQCTKCEYDECKDNCKEIICDCDKCDHNGKCSCICKFEFCDECDCSESACKEDCGKEQCEGGVCKCQCECDGCTQERKYSRFYVLLKAPTTDTKILAEIGGMKVRVIGPGAFDGSEHTSITLPEYVRDIDKTAFKNSKITSVKFNENLETIGDYAFAGTEITTADFSKTKLKSIGDFAFWNTKVTKVDFPDTLEWLGEEAFKGTEAYDKAVEEALKKIDTKEESEESSTSETSYNEYSSISQSIDGVLFETIRMDYLFSTEIEFNVSGEFYEVYEVETHSVYLDREQADYPVESYLGKISSSAQAKSPGDLYVVGAGIQNAYISSDTQKAYREIINYQAGTTYEVGGYRGGAPSAKVAGDKGFLIEFENFTLTRGKREGYENNENLSSAKVKVIFDVRLTIEIRNAYLSVDDLVDEFNGYYKTTFEVFDSVEDGNYETDDGEAVELDQKISLSGKMHNSGSSVSFNAPWFKYSESSETGTGTGTGSSSDENALYQRGTVSGTYGGTMQSYADAQVHLRSKTTYNEDFDINDHDASFKVYVHDVVSEFHNYTDRGVVYLDNWAAGLLRTYATNNVAFKDDTAGFADAMFAHSDRRYKSDHDISNVYYAQNLGSLQRIFLLNSDVSGIPHRAFWNCKNLMYIVPLSINIAEYRLFGFFNDEYSKSALEEPYNLSYNLDPYKRLGNNAYFNANFFVKQFIQEWYYAETGEVDDTNSTIDFQIKRIGEWSLHYEGGASYCYIPQGMEWIDLYGLGNYKYYFEDSHDEAFSEYYMTEHYSVGAFPQFSENIAESNWYQYAYPYYVWTMHDNDAFIDKSYRHLEYFETIFQDYLNLLIDENILSLVNSALGSLSAGSEDAYEWFTDLMQEFKEMEDANFDLWSDHSAESYIRFFYDIYYDAVNNVSNGSERLADQFDATGTYKYLATNKRLLEIIGTLIEGLEATGIWEFPPSVAREFNNLYSKLHRLKDELGKVAAQFTALDIGGAIGWLDGVNEETLKEAYDEIHGAPGRGGWGFSSTLVWGADGGFFDCNGNGIRGGEMRNDGDGEYFWRDPDDEYYYATWRVLALGTMPDRPTPEMIHVSNPDLFGELYNKMVSEGGIAVWAPVTNPMSPDYQWWGVNRLCFHSSDLDEGLDPGSLLSQYPSVPGCETFVEYTVHDDVGSFKSLVSSYGQESRHDLNYKPIPIVSVNLIMNCGHKIIPSDQSGSDGHHIEHARALADLNEECAEMLDKDAFPLHYNQQGFSGLTRVKCSYDSSCVHWNTWRITNFGITYIHDYDTSTSGNELDPAEIYNGYTASYGSTYNFDYSFYGAGGGGGGGAYCGCYQHSLKYYEECKAWWVAQQKEKAEELRDMFQAVSDMYDGMEDTVDDLIDDLEYIHVQPPIIADQSDKEIYVSPGERAELYVILKTNPLDYDQPTFDWYRSLTGKTEDAVKVSISAEDKGQPIYAPPTDDVSVWYYYCIITNSTTVDGQKEIEAVKSDIFRVEVRIEALDPVFRVQPKGDPLLYSQTTNPDVVEVVNLEENTQFNLDVDADEPDYYGHNSQLPVLDAYNHSIISYQWYKVAAYSVAELRDFIKQAEKLKEDEFTEVTWENLKDAIDIAKKVIALEEDNDPETKATTKQIYEAVERILIRITWLEPENGKTAKSLFTFYDNYKIEDDASWKSYDIDTNPQNLTANDGKGVWYYFCRISNTEERGVDHGENYGALTAKCNCNECGCSKDASQCAVSCGCTDCICWSTVATVQSKFIRVSLNVAAIVNAKSPSISESPEDITIGITAGQSMEYHTISVSVDDEEKCTDKDGETVDCGDGKEVWCTKGELTYQWYISASRGPGGSTLPCYDEDGNIIACTHENLCGAKRCAKTSSYKVPVSSYSTNYYYCIITRTLDDNDDGGIKTAESMSRVIRVVVSHIPGATITSQPEEQEYAITTDEDLELSVSASRPGNDQFPVGADASSVEMTYRWYRENSRDARQYVPEDEGGFSGTINPKLEVGLWTYYCEITTTVTISGQSYSSVIISNHISVDVREFLIEKDDLPEPTIDTQPPSGKTLVMGGEPHHDCVFCEVVEVKDSNGNTKKYCVVDGQKSCYLWECESNDPFHTCSESCEPYWVCYCDGCYYEGGCEGCEGTDADGNDINCSEDYCGHYIEIEASIPEGWEYEEYFNLSYQWYRNDVPIFGATHYYLELYNNIPGTWSYHCVVTITVSGNYTKDGKDITKETTSSKTVMEVVFETQDPYLITFPRGATIPMGDIYALSVYAISPDNGANPANGSNISYQWYKQKWIEPTYDQQGNVDEPGHWDEEETVSGATTCTVATYEEGTWQYWCVITNRIQDGAAQGEKKTVETEKVSIIVKEIKFEISQQPSSSMSTSAHVVNGDLYAEYVISYTKYINGDEQDTYPTEPGSYSYYFTATLKYIDHDGYVKTKTLTSESTTITIAEQ